MDSKHDIVVIGTSLGGLNALMVVLRDLPARFALPVVVVQHRAVDAPEGLGALLGTASALPVREVEDKQPIVGGCVYLAPADYHLLIDQAGFALSTEAPVWYARPSIDVLFETAADTYGSRVIGAILTGASEDGARGLARIKQSGGLALVQEPETAECRVMPEAAIAATDVDYVVPLDQIAACLARITST